MRSVREGHYISKDTASSDSKQVIRIKRALNPQNNRMEWADVSNPDIGGGFKFYSDDRILSDFEYIDTYSDDTNSYGDSVNSGDVSSYAPFTNIGDLSSLRRPVDVDVDVESEVVSDNKTKSEVVGQDVDQHGVKEVVREVVREVVHQVPLEDTILDRCRVNDPMSLTLELRLDIGFDIPKLANLINQLELDTVKIVDVIYKGIDVGSSIRSAIHGVIMNNIPSSVKVVDGVVVEKGVDDVCVSDCVDGEVLPSSGMRKELDNVSVVKYRESEILQTLTDIRNNLKSLNP